MSGNTPVLFVSIVVCTHSLEDYPNLAEAVDSLLAQSYQDKEIIIAVDGNRELYRKVLSGFADNNIVRAVLLEKNAGVSEARNAGIRVAKGNVIAFLDDDAVAEKRWIENLVATYHEFAAIAVGGKILPQWDDSKPDYFPEELYWLVGVTNDSFAAEKVVEVRNTFGPNMSFKNEVFREVGLFNSGFGFAGISSVQAEEPEIALRMKKKFGKGVMYNPNAIVYHKIPSTKVGVRLLLKRSFFQGYSKAFIRKLDSSVDSMTPEKSYLKYLLLKKLPQRIKKAYHFTELKKSSVLIASIISVGLGFAYGYLKKDTR